MHSDGKRFACDIDYRMNSLYGGDNHFNKYNIFISKRGSVVSYKYMSIGSIVITITVSVGRF